MLLVNECIPMTAYSRYDVDEDGNIVESSKTEESSGGGKSPNTPTETRPSPDTTTPEETARQQPVAACQKAGSLALPLLEYNQLLFPLSRLARMARCQAVY